MKVSRRLIGSLNLAPTELPALLWAFAYFFCLLCSYYLLRPLRDAMGIAGGVDQLQWLFTATFLVMLAAVPVYGWAVSRFRRARLLPLVYGFFVANLLVFYVLMQVTAEQGTLSAQATTSTTGSSTLIVARVFFVWVSVYNLFVVSVFWSFMADIFSPERAQRLFPAIAAGGTAGALIGPLVAALCSRHFEAHTLLLLSAVTLAATLPCISHLSRWARDHFTTDPENHAQQEPSAVGGSIIAGFTTVMRSPYLLGICVSMLLFSTLATFLYFQQAAIVRDAFSDTASRTTVFASMDFATNALTLITQLFITSRLIKHAGIAVTLALVPAALTVGFIVLSISPALAAVLIVQVLRRAGNYAIMRPAREMLYTVLNRETKYKSKGFIDTAVYRGGDAVSAWAYAAMTSLGLGTTAIAALAVPLSALWAGVAFALGRHHQALRGATTRQQSGDSP